MKHIVFSEAASGALKYALQDEGNIIAFPNFLGEGPIFELLTTEGFAARMEWLQQAFQFDAKMTVRYEDSFKKALKGVEQISEDEHIIIWTCENATEQFGLRLISLLLEGEKCTISVCNTYFNILKLYKGRKTQLEVLILVR